MRPAGLWLPRGPNSQPRVPCSQLGVLLVQEFALVLEPGTLLAKPVISSSAEPCFPRGTSLPLPPDAHTRIT
eukprot:4534296-Amphidinium_carterae.1